MTKQFSYKKQLESLQDNLKIVLESSSKTQNDLYDYAYNPTYQQSCVKKIMHSMGQYDWATHDITIKLTNKEIKTEDIDKAISALDLDKQHIEDSNSTASDTTWEILDVIITSLDITTQEESKKDFKSEKLLRPSIKLTILSRPINASSHSIIN